MTIINGKTRKTLPFVILLAAFISVLYTNLLMRNPQKYTFTMNKSLTVEKGIAKISFEAEPALYMLKIKHELRDISSKSVSINQQKLSVNNIKRKKEIETDYFYITPEYLQDRNTIEVKFSGSSPSNIDLRITNYIPIPSPNFKGELFVLFKDPGAKNNFSVSDFFLALCLLSLIFCLSIPFIAFYSERVTRYIFLGVAIFVSFLILLAINNFAPVSVSPYKIMFSRFFFWAVFSINYILTLMIILPFKK